MAARALTLTEIDIERAGARRHAEGASARFQQDIKVWVDAYERWECPLCVAKILDMDRTFSYLWMRIFYIR